MIKCGKEQGKGRRKEERTGRSEERNKEGARERIEKNREE